MLEVDGNLGEDQEVEQNLEEEEVEGKRNRDLLYVKFLN